MKRNLFIALCFSVLGGCKTKPDVESSHKYHYNSLVTTDCERIDFGTLRMYDTLFEIQDKRRGNRNGGFYVFDSAKQLRFYAFLETDSTYNFSEHFDATGKRTKITGSYLLDAIIENSKTDSCAVIFLLAARQKDYDWIQVVSNYGDTIRPKQLFKYESFSNVSCFKGKIKTPSSIDKVKFFYSLDLVDSASGMTMIHVNDSIPKHN